MRENLKAYNQEMIRKFIVAGQEEAVTKLSKKAADSYTKVFDQTKELYTDLNNVIIGLPAEKQKSAYKILTDTKLTDTQKGMAISDIAGLTGSESSQPNAIQKDLSRLKLYTADYSKAYTESQKGVIKLTELQNNFMQQTGKKYGGTTDANPSGNQNPAASAVSSGGASATPGTPNPATPPPASGGGPNTTPFEPSDGIDTIASGGSKAVNITVTFGKLVEQFIVHAHGLKEGMQEIENQGTEALLRVLNGANKLATRQ